ncbi:Aldo/keto reductase C-terminal domain protein [Candidatus Bandiella woodruffii]|uniref:Aldo/keto reductase C-terminal domain protein n=1 Tax=Candidatus Bandiella euplotis TaxID=1664265 RepID=A0ABZ0UK04_9RICK|nr:Aldo/keto reductase C-terminal domain protein [Candidatus Bandiella woodruffii]
MDSLDLVQFHWWDYNVGDYLEALKILQALKQQGLIQKIGLTNFNTQHLSRIVEEGRIEIESIQVQYSLLDKRPENGLIKYAKTHKIKVFCYGTLAGGFLTKKWLGKDQPNTLENRSLVKYQLIIDEFGGWEKFQQLLSVIVRIADKYQLSTIELITLYMLRYTEADSLILGISAGFHHNILHSLEGFTLSNEELGMIKQYSTAYLSGDVYDLERDFDTKHASIMRYNLNSSILD